MFYVRRYGAGPFCLAVSLLGIENMAVMVMPVEPTRARS